jgi:hypothetical protein
MVIKLRTIAIISASTAAGIMLLMIFLPIYSFVNIDINGIKDSYRVGEEIQFSATISGFARQCAVTQASVIGMDQPNFTQGLYYETPQCGSEDIRFFFAYDIPRGERDFTISLNQTGTYKVLVSYKSLIDNTTSLGEREFMVTG